MRNTIVNDIRAIFGLVRWPNLLFTALVMWLMEKMVAVPLLDRALFGEQLPGWVFYMLMLAVVFIAAGGYAVNDYFDVKIDAVNRPERLIVTRALTKQQAMLSYRIMTGAGVVCGLVVAGWLRSGSLGLIFILVPGLLWFYSSSYKRQFLVGNLIVSAVTALVPLLVGIANTALLDKRYGAELMQYTTLPQELLAWTGGFSFFAFLTMWTREMVKDLQDREGDCELECRTLPIVLGETGTKIIVSVLLLLTAAGAGYAVCCLLPFGRVWGSLPVRYLLFGLWVPLACEAYLLWSAKIAADYRSAQRLMKVVMLLGVSFSIVIKICS